MMNEINNKIDKHLIKKLNTKKFKKINDRISFLLEKTNKNSNEKIINNEKCFIIKISLLTIIILFIITLSSVIINAHREVYNNKISNIEEKVIDLKKTKKSDNTSYNLIARLSLNGEVYEDKYQVIGPKIEMTDEEKVDHILNVLDEKNIKGNNKSLNEITDKLFLETKNAYGAMITWSSDKGYIDAKTGDIFQRFKNQGTSEDTLKVCVELNDIKKIKEFKITILEKKETEDEFKLREAKSILDELVLNNELYNDLDEENSTLINQIKDVNVEWIKVSKEDEKSKIDLSKIIIYILSLSILLIISKISNEKKKNEKEIEEREIDFENFIGEYIILCKAGFNIKNAICYIADNNKTNGIENGFEKELDKIAMKLENGFDTYEVLDEYLKKEPSTIISKTIYSIISNMQRGNDKLTEYLKLILKEITNNKKNIFKKRADENNVKAILPLIIVLIATMLIVVYPAVIALEI